MYPTTTVVFGLAIASISFAQISTVSLYIPGADFQPLVASVVASDATATTYAVQCKPGTDASDCGFPGVFTLTEGPATAAYTLTPEKDENGTLALCVFFGPSAGYFDCSLDSTVSAVCTESFGGTEANDPGMSTETFSGTDFAFQPVEITARATASSGGSPSSAAASATNISSMTGNTLGASATAKTSGSGGSSSGASQTSASQTAATSQAGVSALTENTRLALGGVFVALAIMT
ncbi:hypothetical protein LSUB1_G001873 [Lachnellula subtilissima]|uniref:GPI anchored cell wall protein n=1 Tax=Lachnellula subtilissima TaxID=602034 RepID=A0A8H8S1G6_9HELO|nr:hypothetical protein LSUB1_G001873 [Lachnellula subtilissima]